MKLLDDASRRTAPLRSDVDRTRRPGGRARQYLPKMIKGFAAARPVRASTPRGSSRPIAETHQIPVIAVSVFAMGGDERRLNPIASYIGVAGGLPTGMMRRIAACRRRFAFALAEA